MKKQEKEKNKPKKKKLKNIFIAGLCILIIAGGGFLVFSKISAMRFANDEMTYCSVSTGGGMNGGHSSSTLKKNKDGTVTLTVTQREYHSAREVTTVYQVDPAAFDHLRGIVNEYDLYAASKRPRSGIEVLDGDTTTVSFKYTKGSFSIPDDLQLNKKMRTGFWEVGKYLASLAAGEGETTVEPQTATLYLRSGYTLQFTVEDEFDGRLDGIWDEEYEVSRFKGSGIIISEGKSVDVSGAVPIDKAAAGAIIYNAETQTIMILYADNEFGQEVYQVAFLDGYISSAAPLIAEMEGPYRLYLN